MCFSGGDVHDIVRVVTTELSRKLIIANHLACESVFNVFDSGLFCELNFELLNLELYIKNYLEKNIPETIV